MVQRPQALIRALLLSAALSSVGCTHLDRTYEERAGVIGTEYGQVQRSTHREPAVTASSLSSVYVGYTYEESRWVTTRYKRQRVETYKTEIWVPNAGALTMTLLGAIPLLVQVLTCDELGFMSNPPCMTIIPLMSLGFGVPMLMMMSKEHTSWRSVTTPLDPVSESTAQRSSQRGCAADALVEVQVEGRRWQERTDAGCRLSISEETLLARGIHPVTLVSRDALSLRLESEGMVARVDAPLSGSDRRRSVQIVQAGLMAGLMEVDFVRLMRSGKVGAPIDYQGRSMSYEIPISALSEEFFSAHFKRHEPALRAAYETWLDNCEALSSTRKEIYECLYEVYKRSSP